MGHYYLVAFSNDDTATAALRTQEYFGRRLRNAFICADDNMKLTYRGIKHDIPNVPEPKEITAGVEDTVVARFLGFHYDGCPTGTRFAPAPILHPNETAVTFFDSMHDELRDLTGETVAAVLDAFRQSPEGYMRTVSEKIPDDEQYRKANAIQPILTNDTQQLTPLQAFKNCALRPGDENLLEVQAGYPCNVPETYTPPLRVSEFALKAASPKNKAPGI